MNNRTCRPTNGDYGDYIIKTRAQHDCCAISARVGFLCFLLFRLYRKKLADTDPRWNENTNGPKLDCIRIIYISPKRKPVTNGYLLRFLAEFRSRRFSLYPCNTPIIFSSYRSAFNHSDLPMPRGILGTNYSTVRLGALVMLHTATSLPGFIFVG